LGELGHSFEVVGQLEQVPPDICELGLPRQASERIRHIAVMLAPRLMVAACHTGLGTPNTFNLPNIG
jgi:hypothetical protein